MVSGVGRFFGALALIVMGAAPFAGVSEAIGEVGGFSITVHDDLRIYPIQTAVCAAALLWFRGDYDFSGTTALKLLIGLLIGFLVCGFWISPQELFHQAARTEGFDRFQLEGTHFGHRVIQPTAQRGDFAQRLSEVAACHGLFSGGLENGGDELGGGAAVARVGRDADRRADRERRAAVG